MNMDDMALHAQQFFGTVRNTALGLAEHRDLEALARVLAAALTERSVSRGLVACAW